MIYLNKCGLPSVEFKDIRDIKLYPKQKVITIIHSQGSQDFTIYDLPLQLVLKDKTFTISKSNRGYTIT